MSYSVQEMQSPCADNVVREDDIILMEAPDAYGVMSFPRASMSAHQFHVSRWDQAANFTNT